MPQGDTIAASGNRAALPSVDRLLARPETAALTAAWGRTATTDGLRAVLAIRREAAAINADTAGIISDAARWLAERDRPTLRAVFNLTGTVLHTNLGRALLAEEAVAAVTEAMRRPATLEYNAATGQRGERDDHLRALVQELTGAEDACFVNNNAVALMLVLATLGKGRESIVSRGELIEIGGSFRLPEIMKRAGTRLVEVGTTNRTHPADFTDAIGPKTGLILKAHTSNYVIRGFVAEVPAGKLAEIAREAGVPFVDDLGSGTLVELTRYGLKPERTVQEALRAGADLVTFSGDKLLGGPQAGIIAGRRDLVRLCARNHLKRALRLDKLRIAALAATLRLYRHPETLAARLPTLRQFTRTRAEITAQATRLLPDWHLALPEGWTAAVREVASQIGSGAQPLETLPSAALAAVPPAKRGGAGVEAFARRLRSLPVPVIGRVHDGALLLDLRCLDDEAGFLDALRLIRAET
jgi:L-seryl-tRNA(Ser) seleniumtransferase